MTIIRKLTGFISVVLDDDKKLNDVVASRTMLHNQRRSRKGSHEHFAFSVITMDLRRPVVATDPPSTGRNLKRYSFSFGALLTT